MYYDIGVDVYPATRGARRGSHAGAGQLEETLRPEHDTTPCVARERTGADITAVPERARKHTHRTTVGQQLADVHHRVRRRLHLELHALLLQTRYRHLLPRRQDQFAPRRLD